MQTVKSNLNYDAFKYAFLQGNIRGIRTVMLY